jgi:3-oxoacyl-[acyl-carrier protein] reductase
MNIQGKTALITGASRGIGRAIALELAQQGAKRLFLVARNRQRLVEVAAEIEVFGVEVVTLALDVTQPVEVNIAIANAWKTKGPIHLLVNCAGVAHQAPFLRSPLPKVQEEIATNLMGMYTITRQVARRMAAQGEGTIVNVSSLMGKIDGDVFRYQVGDFRVHPSLTQRTSGTQYPSSCLTTNPNRYRHGTRLTIVPVGGADDSRASG